MKGYSITEDCIGCTLCAKNCPVKAISGELKKRHTIDSERCILCGFCGRLCPKSAILSDKGNRVTKVPKAQWSLPHVSADICAGCSLCVENCPRNCLELTKPKYHGDIHTVATLLRPVDCIGCALCIKACPIEAIWMEDRSEININIAAQKYDR